MRILILGGNGFIGSAVAKLLADRGHQVTALARGIALTKRRMPGLEWVRADIARLVKVLPSIVLALVALAILDER